LVVAAVVLLVARGLHPLKDLAEPEAVAVRAPKTLSMLICLVLPKHLRWAVAEQVEHLFL
jgi:hypothetical protein